MLAVLVKRFPGNRFTYYSDNRYAPYGSRNIDYLKWRVHTVCEELVFRGAEAIALGCNTAGSNLASELRSTYSLPIAAVCPEAFPEKEKTLVMCTPLTALSRGVREYAERGRSRARAAHRKAPFRFATRSGLRAAEDRALFPRSRFAGVHALRLSCGLRFLRARGQTLRRLRARGGRARAVCRLRRRGRGKRSDLRFQRRRRATRIRIFVARTARERIKAQISKFKKISLKFISAYSIIDLLLI